MGIQALEQQPSARDLVSSATLPPERKITKKTLISALCAAPFLASAANLVTNGSFETGTFGQPGSNWTIGEGVHLYSPSQIQYFPPHVGTGFGESIPTDNAPSLSEDAAGEHGIYFVDDSAVQTLTSSAFFVPSTGLYDFGFSSYASANGYVNPGDSSYSVQLGAGSLSGTVGGLLATTWQAQQGQVQLTVGVPYSFALTFTGGGGFANDLVVDRLYVQSAVPEPASTALLFAGLGAVAFVVRRRRASAVRWE